MRKLKPDLCRDEEQFRALANAIPHLAWMADPDGRIFWYNDRWYQYTGGTPQQMEGWGWQSAHDPKCLPEVLHQWRSSLGTGEPFEMVFPLRGADGVFRPFLTRVVPVRDGSGKIVRWMGTNTNISVQREAEEARRRLAAIVESSEDAIISKDLHGIVTSWNAAAERLLGHTAAEMIGQSIKRIIPPQLHPDEDRILDELRSGRRIEHFETVRLTKAGEQIAVSLTISPLKDQQGQVIGAAKILRDIGQRLRVEEALRTSEKLATVGRLAATVAHEINNPLESVINLVYLARHDPTAPPSVREYLSTAEEELGRISQLTRQTLGFYRDRKEPVRVQIAPIVRGLLPVFSSKVANKFIDLRLDLEEDVEIIAVPGDLRQVFANLLSNSIDAVSAYGRISIRVRPACGWRTGPTPGVRITIADTGHGIEPSLRARLFEPFFTAKKEIGTGLGLWVCKSVVDSHGGTIRVRSSVALGKSWTAMSVFFPAAPQCIRKHFLDTDSDAA
ncbi:MAG: PAS domain S-box protein [Terriglobales bacterium]